MDTVFLKRPYVLFFLELASRRIVFTACSEHPGDGWAVQQARNLAWELEEAVLAEYGEHYNEFRPHRRPGVAAAAGAHSTIGRCRTSDPPHPSGQADQRALAAGRLIGALE